ncbi:MAG: FAD:protein FMN transferase [Candidatus Nanopelagicales bacterium]
MRLLTRREHRFPAMGTQCHVVIVGGEADLPARAEARVLDLQARWTRFTPDSEISRLNHRGSGRLSRDSWRLVATGMVGRRITRHVFDPFLGRQIVAAGYDRDFAELTRQPVRPTVAAVPRPVVAWDRRQRWVRLAPGAELDSGGLGKGLAADIVSEELLTAGAVACLVNLGGDLRVRGDKGTPWEIAIDREGPGEDVSVRLRAGGLATSSTTKRRWQTDEGEAHHLLDPRTGRSLRSPWAGATAIAPSAWLAEVFSKALVAGGERRGRAMLRRHHAGGLLQRADGEVVTL